MTLVLLMYIQLKLRSLKLKHSLFSTLLYEFLSSLKGGDSPGPESSMMKTLVTDLEQEISETPLIIGYYGIPSKIPV